jgi:hypothetical protein
MTRFVIGMIILGLFMYGLSSSLHAGDKITPTQKTTVQKTTDPVPQKTTTYNEPTQKPTNQVSQKGGGQALSDVPVPTELLDKLRALQPNEREPLRNFGKALVRKCIKKRIANYVQDNLPSMPLPIP